MTAVTEPAPRACGPCTMCCKLLAVTGFASVEDKPQNEWCRFCLPKGGGCTIYDARPEPCRAFVCAWLEGIGPEATRPDRSKAVLVSRAPLPDGRPVFNVHTDRAAPDAFRQGAFGRMVQELVRLGAVIVVLTGPERVILTNDPSLVQRFADYFHTAGGVGHEGTGALGRGDSGSVPSGSPARLDGPAVDP